MKWKNINFLKTFDKIDLFHKFSKIIPLSLVSKDSGRSLKENIKNFESIMSPFWCYGHFCQSQVFSFGYSYSFFSNEPCADSKHFTFFFIDLPESFDTT